MSGVQLIAHCSEAVGDGSTYSSAFAIRNIDGVIDGHSREQVIHKCCVILLVFRFVLGEDGPLEVVLIHAPYYHTISLSLSSSRVQIWDLLVTLWLTRSNENPKACSVCRAAPQINVNEKTIMLYRIKLLFAYSKTNKNISRAF